MNLDNIAEYRKAGIDCFGIGSIIDKKALAAGDYAVITTLAEQYVKAVHGNG